MRRKIGSVLLAASILLALVPDIAVAAKEEKKPEVMTVQEESDQTETDGGADKSEGKAAGKDADTLLEGSGSETDPYRIQDAEQLRLFADMVNGASGAADTGICAVLTQNIDLSSVCGDGIGSWTPIGTKERPYTGVFDGASFVVSGLYYSKSGASYAGLFGCNSGVIKNLGVAGDVAAGNYTGGVCGSNNGTITGCYSVASVNGGRYTGGVCGCNDGGSVSVCYNTGAVSGSKYVGGISGYNKNTVVDCYNMGVVSGSSTSVGGICGYNRKTVSNCYNTGDVSGKGTDYIGSICGYNYSKSSFLNNYYLITGTEIGNYGTAMTRERFASGEVCWLLNGEKSEGVVWHQTCGVGFPVFGGKTVYQVQTYRGSGDAQELVVWYTNDKAKSGLQTYTTAATEENSNDNSEGNSDGNSEGNSGGSSGSGGNSSGTAERHVYQKPEWKWKEYESAEAVFTCQKCGEKVTRKATIAEKITAATCTVDGKRDYTASVKMDGKTYQDTKTVTIEKTGHQISKVKAVDPTCENVGYQDGYWRCSVCGNYFKDEKGASGASKSEVEISALGHKYSETGQWTWEENGSGYKATVVIACERKDCDKKVTLDGDVESETDATCTKPGKIIYTATKMYDGRKYEDTKIDEGKKLPHDFSGEPEWKWSEDKSSATATFGCSYGCGTTEEKDADIDFETTKATCTVPGDIVYTATVKYNGEMYEDTKAVKGEKLPHDFSGEPEWKWAPDNSSATAIFSCSYDCGTIEEKDADVDCEKKEATCTEPGDTVYTATVVYNKQKYKDIQTIDGETIPHKYKYNGKSAWKWEESGDSVTATVVLICEVCETEESVPAEVTSGVSKDPSCTTTGQTTYTAVAVYDGVEYRDTHDVEIPARHDLEPVQAKEATCTDAGSKKHWECSICHKLFGDEEGSEELSKEKIEIPKKAHVFEYVGGDTYWCSSCEKFYTITEKAGMTSIESLDEDEFIIQDVEENDNTVSQSTEGEEIVEDTGSDDSSTGLALEESQKDGESLTGEEQAGEGGQGEQETQEEQGEQTGEVNQEAQAEQTEQEETSEQGEAEEQNEQPENESGENAVATPEEDSHYGVIYPVEEAGKAGPAISDAQEEGVVNLRAESAANGAVEKEQEQMGRSLGICVVALAVFTGILLVVLLRKKETQ